MPTAEQMKILNKMKRTSGGAYQQAKDTAVKVKGQILPGGITGGKARFMDYKLGLDSKKGNPYIHLIGAVVSPDQYSGYRVQVSHFLAPTTNKTIKDKYDALFSDLQVLGIDTKSMNKENVLELCIDALDGLKEAKQPFEFNTWQPPDGGVFVFLQKTLPEDAVAELGEVVWEGDDPAEDDPEAGTGEAVFEEDPADPNDPGQDGEGAEVDAEEETPADTSAEPSSEEDDMPPVGYGYNYRINSKANAFLCKVTAVDYDNETVDLKREKDGKDFPAVPWSRLEAGE